MNNPKIFKKDKLKLLERFDARNAIIKDGAYVIPIPCALCERYDQVCGCCPLNDCSNWLLNILQDKTNNDSVFSLSDYLYNNYIEWPQKLDHQIRPALAAIQEAISKLETFEEDKKND